jgi:hypothetical protein
LGQRSYLLRCRLLVSLNAEQERNRDFDSGDTYFSRVRDPVEPAPLEKIKTTKRLALFNDVWEARRGGGEARSEGSRPMISHYSHRPKAPLDDKSVGKFTGLTAQPSAVV